MNSKHVALLRGINVGRVKRIAMADLRALVEGLGYGSVRTLLNSGNVVFEGADSSPRDVARRIEQALQKQLGVSSNVVVLSAKEMSAIVSQNTLDEIATNPSRLFVAVPIDPKDRHELKPLMKQEWEPEVLAIGSRAAYIWCPEGMIGSKLPEAVAKVLGDRVTVRNWATITKLHGMMNSSLGSSAK